MILSSGVVNGPEQKANEAVAGIRKLKTWKAIA